MLRLTEIILPLSTSQDDIENTLRAAACSRLGIGPQDLRALTIFRRSYDARKRSAITLTYSIDVEVADEAAVLKRLAGLRTVAPTPPMEYQYVGQAPADLPEGSRPVVIGFGPCGLFAALILAQMGFRPIILERGRVVRERTKDTWGLWRKNTLQPESNVQFGEGGAGTFSDGKLSTQVKDPKHYGRKVLQEFVAADAPPEILYVSKPHIGTFRLVKMIEQMRAQIASLGGEFRFESRVDDIEIEDGRVRGVRLAGGEFIAARHVVLAV
ncbi:NAD(P)/FAD-dependent oxidoreductase, partial [Achromobacter insuavis]